MFDISLFENMEITERYEMMVSMLESLIMDESEWITNLSNATALINALIDRVSWCGFYLLKNKELILGPFQGMPACTKIQLGKGVCGKVAELKETIIVKNVHEVKDHIACDASSNSEIVIPIIKDEILYGVLDLDSTEMGRFSELEKLYLEKSVEILNKYIKWETIIQ
ncbi:MAG: GAF domain-containing protein [Clostridiaceae bacterium]